MDFARLILEINKKFVRKLLNIFVPVDIGFFLSYIINYKIIIIN